MKNNNFMEFIENIYYTGAALGGKITTYDEVTKLYHEKKIDPIQEIDDETYVVRMGDKYLDLIVM